MKNPAAVELGKKSAKARFKGLTEEEKSAVMRALRKGKKKKR